MESRYSNMLVVLAVTFLYSSGMPILYFTACLFFLVTYWVDKCMLLRCYRKPINFNNYMALSTLGSYKYICFLHLIGSVLMFGLTPILPMRLDFSSDKEPSQWQFHTNYGEFTLYSLYVWLVIIILVLFIFINLPVRAIRSCVEKCRRKEILESESNIHFSDDFYECVSFTALKESLIRTQETLDRARQMRRTGKHEMEDCNRYVKMLQDQRASIVSRINQVCEQVLPEDKIATVSQIDEKIAALNEIDQINHIEVGKINGDLQSYDLHRSPLDFPLP